MRSLPMHDVPGQERMDFGKWCAATAKKQNLSSTKKAVDAQDLRATKSASGGVCGMIAYVTVGADDIARAKMFYSAFLPALDYELEEGPDVLSYVLPKQYGQSFALPDFYVKPPFDGLAASAGNGAMIAFEAGSQKQVRDLHSAALAAGGSDAGQPDFRDTYGPHFYVGYLRDPQGNKIALFSNDPNEARRDR